MGSSPIPKHTCLTLPTDVGSSPTTEHTCLTPKAGVFIGQFVTKAGVLTGQYITTAGVLTGHFVTTAGVLTGHFVNIFKIRSYMYIIYMISKQTHVSNKMDS